MSDLLFVFGLTLIGSVAALRLALKDKPEIIKTRLEVATAVLVLLVAAPVSAWWTRHVWLSKAPPDPEVTQAATIVSQSDGRHFLRVEVKVKYVGDSGSDALFCLKAQNVHQMVPDRLPPPGARDPNVKLDQSPKEWPVLNGWFIPCGEKGNAMAILSPGDSGMFYRDYLLPAETRVVEVYSSVMRSPGEADYTAWKDDPNGGWDVQQIIDLDAVEIPRRKP